MAIGKACLLILALALLPLASSATAQTPDENQGDRSQNTQPENQATSDETYENDAGREDQDQQAHQDDLEGRDEATRANRNEREQGPVRDRVQSDRAEARQDARQQRRDSRGGYASNREPAIGVTVVERSGMGVRVVGVVRQSPAGQAGIRPGDTIIEVDGRRVDSPPELVSVIQSSEPGQTVELAVIRDGREHAVPVRLATREQALPPALLRRDAPWAQQHGASSEFGQRQRDRDRQAWRDDEYQPRENEFQRPGEYGGRPFQERDAFMTPPAPPEAPFGEQAEAGSADRTQQASYGAARPEDAQQGRRWRDQDDDRQLGERLAERLERLEARFDRLTQVIERLQQRGGSAESSESSGPAEPSSPPNAPSADGSPSEPPNQQ
jgi:hypothetical protein